MKVRLLQLQGHVQQLAGNAERSTALDDDDDQSAAGSNRIELPAAPLQRLPFMIPGRRAWSSKCARPSALST